MKTLFAACAAALICGLVQQASAQSDVGSPPVVTLEDAIARIVEAAPAIRASEESLRASHGSVLQARVRPNPVLTMEAENLGGSGAFNALDRAELTLGVGQQLERGGKRQARIGVAEAERDMAQLSAAITHRDVVYSAHQAYIEAMAAGAVLKNAEKRAETARTLDVAVRKRVESARDSAAARDRVAARALEAKADLDQAQYALTLAKRRLSSLWGTAEDDFEIDRNRFFEVTLLDEATLRDRLDNTPDIKLAEAAEDRASAAWALERANAKQDPTINLGVRQFQQSDDVAAIVSVSMPIAFFNTNRGNIERASAERRRSEWLARDIRMQFDRALETNMGTRQAAYADVQMFRDNIIPKAQNALNETRAGYSQGAFTYLEVLEAQQALHGFQAREISALKRFHIANANLDRLIARFDEPLSGEENF